MGSVHKLNENVRTYTFLHGQSVTIEKVRELRLSASGNHRLKTADGKLHIIPGGWLHIEIDSEVKEWEL